MKAAEARVLLTGAAGGIGTAAAAAFVKAGASVMLVGRSPARLSTQARALSRHCDSKTPRVAWHAADLNSAPALAELCEAAASWRCNVLVHSAGVPSFGRLETLSPDDIAQVLHTNLLAPMLLTQALLPHLRRLPRAQVICVGSALGRIGLPGYSVYSASKFGLRGFAEALRRELGGTSVRVQYLGPRSTRTDFNSAEVEAYNRATGTAMDSAVVVAHAMMQLMESEAAERFLGFPETLAVRLNGLVPGLMDSAFVKHRNSLPAASRDNAKSDSPPLNTAL
ncbi:MAG: SDR family oxidoreductase [Variovorax sp.]|nr:MAG: SDR family oxidoreductase [Variovorax sp.]